LSVTSRAQFGLIGLGTMGSNLALNIEEHGFPVAVWNLEVERTAEFVAEHAGREFTPADTFGELVAAIAPPRRILMMIPAGKPVDQTLTDLTPLLEPGDIVIDGGNSNYNDTERRSGQLTDRGLAFFGVGVSGGAEGARHGPSLMPGGPREAYDAIRPVLEAIAAETAFGPCVGYLGSGGGGHFVKMVHNGIEYADMQSIAEAYDVLGNGAGVNTDSLAELFGAWNEGPLASYLIEITAEILRVRDTATDQPLVEQIVDEASQKGTGRWTAVTAFELGVPVPSIVAAVDARVLSSRRAERQRADRLLQGPERSLADGDREQLAGDVRDALYGSRIAAFAQGMDLIAQGSDHYDWSIPLAEVARVWMGGCIIRAKLLEPIRSAFDSQPELVNLLLDDDIAERINGAQPGWRRAIATATRLGIPVPCWSASLAYYDGYRSARLPHNLTQAQRDYFGSHTYRRLDDPQSEPVHTDWEAHAREAAK
jgi:6-phosphogluconate dehydrogenase